MNKKLSWIRNPLQISRFHIFIGNFKIKNDQPKMCEIVGLKYVFLYIILINALCYFCVSGKVLVMWTLFTNMSLLQNGIKLTRCLVRIAKIVSCRNRK